MPLSTHRRQVTFSFAVFVLFTALIVGVALTFSGTRHVDSKARKLAAENKALLVQVSALAIEGKEAHDGICALKVDFRRRIIASDAFLAEHPNGIPGIDNETIQNSLKNTRATLKSLGAVKCPDDPPAP